MPHAAETPLVVGGRYRHGRLCGLRKVFRTNGKYGATPPLPANVVDSLLRFRSVFAARFGRKHAEWARWRRQLHDNRSYLIVSLYMLAGYVESWLSGPFQLKRQRLMQADRCSLTISKLGDETAGFQSTFVESRSLCCKRIMASAFAYDIAD